LRVCGDAREVGEGKHEAVAHAHLLRARVARVFPKKKNELKVKKSFKKYTKV